MRKWAAVLGVLLVVLVVPAVLNAEMMRVRSTSANIRSAPSLQAQVIAVLERGTPVQVLQWSGFSGNWAHVSASHKGRGVEGYLYGSLLEAVPLEAVAVAVSSQPPRPAEHAEMLEPPELPASLGQPVKAAPLNPKTTNTVGLGVGAGGFTLGLGPHIRYWRSDRLGFDVGLSHYSVGSSDQILGIVVSGKASVLQLAPSVLFRWPDTQDPKSMKVRPYVGGGINVSFTSVGAGVNAYGYKADYADSSVDFGGQAFAGLEFFYAKAPRLSLTADIGYQTATTPFAGVQVGGFAVNTAIHWYVR